MIRKVIGLIVVASLLMLTGCQTAPDGTLYQQLGGKAGLARIVDSFIGQIGRDKQVFHFFAKADVQHFRHGFITHLCDITDGPCDYQGDTMQDIHTGMHITERNFNHIVDLLVAAMNENNIPVVVQNALLARLAPLRKDIIYR